MYVIKGNIKVMMRWKKALIKKKRKFLIEKGSSSKQFVMTIYASKRYV